MTLGAPAADLVRQLRPEAAELATAVSLATRIEPQLIRRMRLSLFPAFDAGVEADLWFSPLVESRTHTGIVLHAPVVSVLHEDLRRSPGLLEGAWPVIELLHRNLSPALFAEERLTYLALSGRVDEMRELLRTLVATVRAPLRHGLAGWAARALDRLPREARALEEAHMLAWGASLRMGDAAALSGFSQDASLPEWTSWLIPENWETVPVGVALLEDAIEFGPPGRSLSQTLNLPYTSPIMVELQWDDSGHPHIESLTLQPGTVQIVETGPGVSQIDIRTLLGDGYSLTVPAPKRSAQRKLTRVRAPRVHIVTDIETGNAVEFPELPFVIAVLGDFMVQRILPPLELRDRRFVEVTPDNFDDVLRRMEPRIEVGVLNRLGSEDTTLMVDLTFESMEDFKPDRIVSRIPILSLLVKLRSSLSDLGGSLAVNQHLEELLDSMLKDPTMLVQLESEFTAPGPLLEKLLSDRGFGFSPSRGIDLLRAFVHSVRTSRAGIPLRAEDLIAQGVRDLDRQLSAQLDEILHHKDFQRLEAAWRGLRYLIDQAETGPICKIRILHVTKSELFADYQARSAGHGSLFQKIYEDGFGRYGGNPLSLLVGNYAFARQRDDIELLEHVAGTAAAAHCPFIAAVIQLGHYSRRSMGPAIAGEDAARWKSFRESEDSQYVGLALPNILLRVPYGSTNIPIHAFRYEESIDLTHDADYLWGNPAYALAVTIARSFARNDFGSVIRGPAGGGLVEGLPLHQFLNPEGDFAMRSPIQTPISDRTENELANQGFIPLVQEHNKDSAAFFSVVSCRKPPVFRDDEANRNARRAIELPYTLMVCRFAQYMKILMRNKIGSAMSKDHVQRYLESWINDYVLLMDDASAEVRAQRPLREARIEVEDDTDLPGCYRVVMFLRPHLVPDELTIFLRTVVTLPQRH